MQGWQLKFTQEEVREAVGALIRWRSEALPLGFHRSVKVTDQLLVKFNSIDTRFQQRTSSPAAQRANR